MYLNNCITLLDQFEQDLKDQLGHIFKYRAISANVSEWYYCKAGTSLLL